MGKVMQAASFSYAEVTYAAGDIGFQVRENVKTAKFKVRTRQENVSGVMLPTFEKWIEQSAATELTGLGRGGQQVQKCRDTYAKAVEALIDIASLQVSSLFVTK
jgi:V-type H+-transporting ATPase subunit D